MIKKVELNEAKYIYRTGVMRDFPIAERIPYSRFKRAVKNKTMKTYSYLVDEKRYGYIVTLEEDGVVFLSYLAIEKDYRNQGYGSKMLEELYEYFKDRKYIIIEADSPIGIKNEKELDIINRRKKFYFRNGFEEIKNVEYRIFGVRYDILVYKLNCKEVTAKDATEMTKKMYSKITYNMRFFHIEATN